MAIWSVGLVFAPHQLQRPFVCCAKGEEKMGMLCTIERREVSFFLQRHELSLLCGNSKSHAYKSALLLLLQRAVEVVSVAALRANPGAFEQTFSPTVDILVASESWSPVTHNGMVAG